ncbi:hypothetical protein PQX77_011185 [Marasmius sp. AFHP31]|nr:hypothetical protein PQX77_011185 [Marasmius sp. AFHP31]
MFNTLDAITKIEFGTSENTISPTWDIVAKKFPPSLRNLLVEVSTLSIQPVGYQLQKSTLTTFSQISTLVLHGGMAPRADHRWDHVELELLTDLTLVSSSISKRIHTYLRLYD